METHHHSHIHHDKKWKDYLLEFIMIFLAVTLGFFAESYREYSVEKARAKEYAGSLIHDLEKDTAMVRIDMLEMEIITAKIDSFAGFMQGRKMKDISNKALFAYTHFNCDYKPYTWNRATLDEIKSSGSLRYFNNDSVVMKISAYDALTRHLDEDMNGDQRRNEKVTEQKDRIVDLNYGLADSLVFWRISPDSAIKLVTERENSNSGFKLTLLTNNINDIKGLLNQYLGIKEQFEGRGETELPHLIHDAADLITMLKKEYHYQ